VRVVEDVEDVLTGDLAHRSSNHCAGTTTDGGEGRVVRQTTTVADRTITSVSGRPSSPPGSTEVQRAVRSSPVTCVAHGRVCRQ
jgi:hypothetical protein